jgi:effector-binding domain-containing protein
MTVREETMFRIGDFSKLSQVSVKALRYYDEIGLLKPADVDRFTGYRYYSVDQLPRLNRILALKDLGFSLERIAQLLDDDLPPAQIRGMLQMKQAEIEQHLEAEGARLARVEARLRQIEQEGKMPTYDVVLKQIEPLKVVAARGVIPTYGDVGKLFGAVFGHLGQHRTQPSGPPLAIYHDGEYREQDVDAEAAVPVAESLPGGEQVTVQELPGGEMASVIHKGGYQTISEAYAALMAWIEASGYNVAGPNREIYLTGPGDADDPADYVTEVQLPVEKA